MSDDHTDHTQEGIGSEAPPTATGWNEIRAALEEIELMRNNGMSDARLVLLPVFIKNDAKAEM
jgi:hypothetical protein